MANLPAFPRIGAREAQLEILRTMIVCGCALALIAAKQALPF